MKRLVLALVLCLSTSLATARVISYAPYSDRTTIPAFQHRNTRHFLTVELTNPYWLTKASLWEVVLYDSTGAEEPRVVFSSKTRLYWAAMFEDAQQRPAILIAQDTGEMSALPAVLFSSDAGRSFIRTALPGVSGLTANDGYVDHGGPYTRGRYAPVRMGNGEFPFVVSDRDAVWRVAANGVATEWMPASGVIGSDVTGTRFLIYTRRNELTIAGFDGSMKSLMVGDLSSTYAGWITTDGRVYLQTDTTLRHIAPAGDTSHAATFAIPTHDYSGAWIVERTKVTKLLRHTSARGFEEMFVDESAPLIEALHAGASGNTLLLQVHRPRQQDRFFTDPALAVWHVGEPAPAEYDELFLAEQTNKGFVHVDPDRVADGEAFVFDSGIQVPRNGGVVTAPSTPAGGLETLQESGIVRASLKQQLVLPGGGRALGAFGSNWTTDVTLYNPEPVPQKVEIRFVQAGPTADHTDTQTVTLNAKEIRIIPDVLNTLFGRVGNGAIFLTPERDINATGRTYTRLGAGSFGFGMNAIDVFAGASPRLPVTFAGAFPGANFRTNVTLTDVTGRGSDVTFAANGATGLIGSQNAVYEVPASGQQQINSVETELGIPSTEGGLRIQPKRGFIVPSVFAIDNRTNDPTYFPPDASTSIPRWIAVMGHVDGANGAKFRTDLYLYNTSSQRSSVFLTARPWNTGEGAVGSLLVELQGNESRVIRDAYLMLFGLTGTGRLRYFSAQPDSGVRVTARTYSVAANGGTYGYLTPPVNGFQIAGSGEALEILVNGGAGSRANLGIVEMNNVPTRIMDPVDVRIQINDQAGKTIDDFNVSVPIAGGMQLNDIFRTRGHGDGPIAAVIRVMPSHGSISAYATVTDNATNDSIYLAPYLAAQRK